MLQLRPFQPRSWPTAGLIPLRRVALLGVAALVLDAALAETIAAQTTAPNPSYPTAVTTHDLGAADDGTRLGQITTRRPVRPGASGGSNRSPVVLAVGSIASRGGEFAALAETLATHGIVTVEVIPHPSGAPPGFDLAAVQRGIDRLRRARELLSGDPGIDGGRTGIVAWSFGGVPAAVTACREARAFVSLDSALRYRYGADLLRAQRFNASECTAGLLAIDAGIPNTVPTDGAFVAAWPAARVERRVGHGLAHAGFVDLGDRSPADQPAPAVYRRLLDDVVAYFVDRLKP